MDHAQFRIGLEFWCGCRQWRCTDVGLRTVIAIRIDEATIGTLEGGERRSRTITRVEAEESGWFSGPPYGVAEMVFDEDDLEGCSLEREGP